jgi:two-component system, NtrC family, nitrogen regulation sensor histidine kinase NtrY
MLRFGIRRRLTLAILVTALIPVLVAIWLAETTVRQTSARFFVPEVGARLDRSLGLYQELARAVKREMKSEAEAVAADPELKRALDARDEPALKRELSRLIGAHPTLVSLAVRDGERELAKADRGRPLDPRTENQLEVVRSLRGSTPDTPGQAADAVEAPAKSADPLPKAPEPVRAPETTGKDRAEAPLVEDDDVVVGPELVAVFAAEKARFDELGEASQFVDSYRSIERRREADERSYVLAFSALLGITILAAVGVGSLVARDVARRVVELEGATQKVALGDLSVRVPESADDELGRLARAFNRMLEEVEASRTRIEYLQRISAWQEMARRLAHEIKNPLTPIQLAVQDIHRRYDGQNPEYRKLLDTTLEVVEDEVGTLRRLVGEFSDFARLPRAELERADLVEFLKEISERSLLLEDERRGKAGSGEGARVEFEIPEGPATAEIDRQMLRRVLVNLVRNAAQAHDGANGGGRVLVRLGRDGDFWNLDVDDDGPGIPDELRQAVFDPYVTTKTEGTGLGLAIVKKIVIEHRGVISASKSALGGARLRVRLPALS